MQSPLGIVIRSVVVLAALIGLPAVAAFWDMIRLPSRVESSPPAVEEPAEPVRRLSAPEPAAVTPHATMPDPATRVDAAGTPPAAQRDVPRVPTAGSASTRRTALSAHVQPDEAFQIAASRLRSLGATHYRLESWGDRSQLYRFECRVGVGDHDSLNRHFEATDADPMQAIRRVVREVEHWQARMARSGGQGAGGQQR